jgi:hypothetical protein
MAAISKDQCGAVWQSPHVVDNCLYRRLDLGGLAVEAQLFWLQSGYDKAPLLYQLEAGHDASNLTLTPAGTRDLP